MGRVEILVSESWLEYCLVPETPGQYKEGFIGVNTDCPPCLWLLKVNSFAMEGDAPFFKQCVLCATEWTKHLTVQRDDCRE